MLMTPVALPPIVVAAALPPIDELKLTAVPLATGTPRASVIVACTVIALPQFTIAGLTARLIFAGTPATYGALHWYA
jgi:hypothetical protein